MTSQSPGDRGQGLWLKLRGSLEEDLLYCLHKMFASVTHHGKGLQQVGQGLRGIGFRATLGQDILLYGCKDSATTLTQCRKGPGYQRNLLGSQILELSACNLSKPTKKLRIVLLK
mmetsp:Transcript_11138/g.24891  ORF Transcript_11138/g.24891 Transcript_11138/m.24891 type:complete len:115 (+) Transcript_11138:2538-2882(+)